tara:strand:- start:512 stop:619 length:108 start_codon:yes stop_codon:yes gene_type:complete
MRRKKKAVLPASVALSEVIPEIMLDIRRGMMMSCR